MAPLWLPPPSRSMSSITLTPTPASHLATFTSQFPHNHQSGLHHASCSQAPPRTEPKALVTAHQGLRDMALVYHCVLSAAAKHSSWPDLHQMEYRLPQGFALAVALPEMLFLQSCLMTCPFTSFKSLLQCYLFTETFPDCSPLLAASSFIALFRTEMA